MISSYYGHSSPSLYAGTTGPVSRWSTCPWHLTYTALLLTGTKFVVVFLRPRVQNRKLMTCHSTDWTLESARFTPWIASSLAKTNKSTISWFLFVAKDESSIEHHLIATRNLTAGNLSTSNGRDNHFSFPSGDLLGRLQSVAAQRPDLHT